MQWNSNKGKKKISNYIPTMWMEKARHKIVYTLLFYLHKTQKERKLIHTVSNQNIGYYCIGGGKEWEWLRENVFGYSKYLFLDLNFKFIRVTLT